MFDYPVPKMFGASSAERMALMFSWRKRKALEPLDGLLALVVTDLQSFTSLVTKLGDSEARAWIREHNRLVRDAISQDGGREVAHTGDGVIAAFRSLNAALRCTSSIQDQLADYTRRHSERPLCARIGVHAGEPLPEDGRLFGTAVNTTVRVCNRARAGQILVTDVVRQLSLGCGFEFVEQGSAQLKGLRDDMRLYELLSERSSQLQRRSA